MKLNFIEKILIGHSFRVRLQRKHEAKEVLTHLPLLKGASCLELGCGYGAGALLIKHYTGCGSLVSLDIDRTMLNRARTYVSEIHPWSSDISRNGVSFVEGNARSLPFASANFDAVFHFFLLDHIASWPDVIAEVHRVLKSGGVYSFEDALIPDSPYLFNRLFGHIPLTEREIGEIVERQGFMIDRLQVKSSGFRRIFLTCRKMNGDEH